MKGASPSLRGHRRLSRGEILEPSLENRGLSRLSRQREREGRIVPLKLFCLLGHLGGSVG